ncbi:DNA mismatch repair endonuclease MutL, partial [bacterium]
MSDIIILPEILINKIAAGEVIERPASVVRELIDNSIDAGARSITVDVLNGGKKLIRVIDDGCGMDRDDASLCFERHATSKIKSEDNLFHITTLGFRGEALASIGSVSKVTLVTSPGTSGTGTKVEIGTNTQKGITDAPPVTGTTVEIRDIFYNTPARRKFLKSTSTELSHIIESVTQKALAYPHISFSLTHNRGEIVHVTSAQSLKERFFQLYGDDFASEFSEVKREERGIKLYGFCSVPEFTRATRSYQFVFINTRPVKNPTVSHAVYSAYRDVIEKERHPAFFLFLEIDPGSVDVNVHPAKREVRFESSEEVHRIVSQGIKDVLHTQPRKDSEYEQSREAVGVEAERTWQNDYQSTQEVRETLESAIQTTGGFEKGFFNDTIAPALHKYFHIGEAFVADITGNGLMIVDRHAAHERILYEKLLSKTRLEVENLLLPIRVELPAKEYSVIMNNKKLLKDFGIDLDDFGANSV